MTRIRWLCMLSGMVLASAFAVACGWSDDDATVRDPARVVERAARATLRQPSNAIDANVRGPGVVYVFTGAVAPAVDRYSVEARFKTGEPVFPRSRIGIVGAHGESYIDSLDPGGGSGRCWFDPHLPIGSAPRTTSAQETLQLTGVIVRLLAHDVTRARLLGAGKGSAVRFAVWVDPRKARAVDPRSDEVYFAKPARLARAVRLPIEVSVLDRRLSRLRLQLPDYTPAAFLPKYSGKGRSIIDIYLVPRDKKIELDAPNCIAME